MRRSHTAATEDEHDRSWIGLGRGLSPRVYKCRCRPREMMTDIYLVKETLARCALDWAVSQRGTSSSYRLMSGTWNAGRVGRKDGAAARLSSHNVVTTDPDPLTVAP
jgi:hypothetical protein